MSGCLREIELQLVDENSHELKHHDDYVSRGCVRICRSLYSLVSLTTQNWNTLYPSLVKMSERLKELGVNDDTEAGNV